MRGPVKCRITAEPASGLVIIFNIDTTSATSGICINPPIPITSTGRPASRKALSMAVICARFRTRTAAVFPEVALQFSFMYSVIAAASASIVSKIPYAISPIPALIRASSSTTCCPPADLISSLMRFAAAKIIASFLKVVGKVNCAVPFCESLFGKYVLKDAIVPAEAPRHV